MSDPRSEVMSARSPRRQRSGGTRRALALRVGSVLITLVAWEFYGRSINPIFLSYPTAIAEAVPQLFGSGELPRAIAQSSQALVAGFLLAVVLGTLIGLAMGRYRTVDYLLDVQVNALYSTPTVVLVPLIILWFGLDVESKIVVIFLSVVFPMIVNTYAGVRNVGRNLIQIVQAEGATELQIFTKIIVPAAIPFIMTGIRLAVGRAVVGMVVAEFFTAINGLGGVIIAYSNAFATAKVFVAIAVLVILGVGLTEAARWLEHRVAPWKETERAT
jgi:NitT/TauT family transport system permease protein